MAEPNSSASRRALERVLSSTDLERLVPTLAPAELHRAIQICGIEDAGDVLALATQEQLRDLSDLDLWRAERPGQTETFDASRFGVWLEVLLGAGQSVVAQRLADLDRDVVATGLAQHVRAFHEVAVSEFMTLDGERASHRHRDDRLSAEIGGFYVVGRRDDAWDVIVEALRCLEAEQPSCFAEVMSAVLAVSNAGYEVDGLDELLDRGEQQAFDARAGREVRLEQQGYVSAGDARAFLEAARRTHVAAMRDAKCPMPDATRALVPSAGPDMSRVPRLGEAMAWLLGHDPDAYEARNADLVFLANTLVSGGALQGRRFTPQEAWDAATATCNLALDRLDAPEDVLAGHSIIDVFRHGWSVLHDDVAMHAADELAAALAHVRCPDRLTQMDLQALRFDLLKQLRAGTPWKAHARMDVLLSLDGPAWETLVGLIAECPTWRQTFISNEDDLSQVRQFLRSLPRMLA